MNHSKAVMSDTEAGRNEWLRTCHPVKLSNEDLLDAQRATAADIEKDEADITLRDRYNALATEYGVRVNRGEQLVDAETVAKHENNLLWFFDIDTMNVDDEDFRAYCVTEPAISPADAVAYILRRPISLTTCEELSFFASIIARRLGGMDNSDNSYSFLAERLEAIDAADTDRHGLLCATCGKREKQT